MRSIFTIFTLIFSMMISFCSSDEVIKPKQESYNHSEGEYDLINKINEYRVSNGLPSLSIIEHISYKCNEHNTYMISRGKISHDYFYSRSENIKSVLGAKRVGENVAYNFTSNTSVLNAWLNSPGHKNNIEGDYTHIGLSISIENGKKYYTNIFVKI